jgi:hypothetical protein
MAQPNDVKSILELGAPNAESLLRKKEAMKQKDKKKRPGKSTVRFGTVNSM